MLNIVDGPTENVVDVSAKEEYFMAYDQNKAKNGGGTANTAEGPKGDLTDGDKEKEIDKGEGDGSISLEWHSRGCKAMVKVRW
nr:hypothetical protein [Tanacetum cinerariifolium]